MNSRQPIPKSYARGLRYVHPLNMNAIGMAADALLLALVSLLAGEHVPSRHAFQITNTVYF